jgi:hypothetical protein
LGGSEIVSSLTENNLATEEDVSSLRQDMNEMFAWWARCIVPGNAATTAALLALYGFAS